MSKKTIYAADCETNPFDGTVNITPFIWGICDGRNYWEFDTTEQFVEFVSGLDGIVYAHNGGKFDWHFLLDYINPYEEITVISGRLAKFHIGDCEFRDSFNIIPVGLGAYQKDVIDYNIFTPEERVKPENDKKIRKYLKSDCKYLYDMVHAYIEEYGLNLTQAGTAFKQWKEISGISPDPTDADFYAEMSQFYYGGRVESFKKGIFNAPLKVIDINSAYPFAMMAQHPFSPFYNNSTELPDSDDKISRAFITMTARGLGAFPYRDKNGLSFPNDGEIREFSITGWEYLAARRTGALKDVTIINVKTCAGAIDFVDYINKFFALKQDADNRLAIDPDDSQAKIDRLFAKLFLNSLYGKWASNPENYNHFCIVPENNVHAFMVTGLSASDDREWLPSGILGSRRIMCADLEPDEMNYYNVATAASITGFVRAYMWESMQKCSNVYYCDTDSIICEATGDLELHPSKLGAWDVEAVGDFGAFAGKKLYAVRKDNGKYKIASKGARLTPDEIISVAKGETVQYNSLAPTFSAKNGRSITKRKIKMT
jgi:hypothetical protein